MFCLIALHNYNKVDPKKAKEASAIIESVLYDSSSMAIENAELMQECFLKLSHMGTARMKEDKETEEKGKH